MMGQALRVIGVVVCLLAMAVCAGLAWLGITIWTQPGYRGDSEAMKVALLVCLVVALAAGWGVYMLMRRLRRIP